MAAMYTSADEDTRQSVARVVTQVVGKEKTVVEWANSALGGRHPDAGLMPT
jgi:hypothetical protein